MTVVSPARKCLNHATHCSWMKCCQWLILCLLCPVLAIADDDAEEPEPEVAKPQPRTFRKSATSDGPGVLTSVGFLAGPTLGRDDSIAPLEVMPYMLFDPHFVFADVRGFVSTEGNFGGNIGAGYRHLNEGLGGWYGVNGWVDVDQTSGEVFTQLGLGFEAVWNRWEARSNLYLPVGDRQQILEQTAVDKHFVGHQLWFDQQTTVGNSLAGVDGEIGFTWAIEPFDIPTIIRGFVGGYHFVGDTGDDINGFRTRLESTINSSVITQVEYTSDNEYGQNVFAGVTLQFPWGGAHPSSNWKRNTPTPFRAVKRNYNVVLDRQESFAADVIAMNPLTSQPYFFQHVDTHAAAGGDGTAETPYANFTPATSGNPDIILVHSGSVLNETLVIPNDTRVWGMNGLQSINTSNLGRLTLPGDSDSSADTPRITGVIGNAVTIGSNSELTGFVIDDIHGNGIVGSDGSNVTLRDLELHDISGDAIQFTGVSANTLKLTDLDISQVGGQAVSVRNLEGDLVATRLTIDDTDGSSIFLDSGSGDAYFYGTTMITGDKSHINILNTEGHVEFADLQITGNSATPLVALSNILGDVEFSALTLENAGGSGLIANNVELLTVTNGSIETTGGPAIDLTDSELAVRLASVQVTDGPVGMRLSNVTGSVSILDGTIDDTATAVDLDEVGTVNLQSLVLTGNDVGIKSQGAEYLRLDGLTITETTGYALDSTNDALLSVNNSTFTDNGALDAGTIRVAANQSDLYRSEFNNNGIGDSRGTALQFVTTADDTGAKLSTTINGNTFLVTRGGQSAILIDWNGEVGATITSNTIQLNGSSMTGIEIHATSPDDNLSTSITSNDLYMNGSNGIGVDILSTSTSDTTLGANQIVTTTTGNIGFRLQFDAETQTWIYSNVIDDSSGGGGTGMKFINVADLSQLQIEDNVIDLTSSSSSVDRGIRFDSLGDDVEFFGNYDNTVSGATDPIYIPSGKGIGGFYVNGTLEP
ncbi:hypothetical protein GC163_07690 [bacterium]|nr:hypothetical protein [bacterium]